MSQHKETCPNIVFTITGNGRKNHDNPLPKLKMTGKQHWTAKAQKYVAYKAYVVNTLLQAMEKEKHPAYAMMMRNAGIKGKPLNTKKNLRGRMDLSIHWGNDAHGDPENIFGAIADALFDNDKYLDGSFVSQSSEDGHAKVDVVIQLQEI